jgi:pSer/pThr/pTyr-binding forkhead associated (FHA) protein
MSNNCNRCGEVLDPSWSFCMQCGAPLGETDEGTAPVPGTSEEKKKFKLVLIRGDGGQTASYSLGGSEQVAGREEGIILFPDDDTVSKAHANFFHTDGRLLVRDLGSANGTFYKVTTPVQLRAEDRFICGEQLLRVEEGTTVEPQADEEGTYFAGTPVSNWYFKLVQVLKGGGPGAVHCARKPKVVMGREKAEFSFPDDKFMSHKHCMVEYRDSSLWLSDIGSRNGTFMMLRNDEEKVLNEGDYLFLGRQLIKVVI